MKSSTVFEKMLKILIKDGPGSQGLCVIYLQAHRLLAHKSQSEVLSYEERQPFQNYLEKQFKPRKPHYTRWGTVSRRYGVRGPFWWPMDRKGHEMRKLALGFVIAMAKANGD